ncbi:hypothetical protein [Epilithonimonas sp.]|uniref:hypothetical protein n=1 Tax=Epilithonimonas sp. TaxID=2894511 RepID=UPI00289AD975|nr:hypothetical protein [Epilithonimonas sp.]
MKFGMKNIIAIIFLLCFGSLFFGQSDSLYKKFLDQSQKHYRQNCKKDSLKAVSDSKEINKYYMNIPAPYGDEFLPASELEIILRENNISWGGYYMGSDIGGYNGECYELYMTKETEKKYGKDFIDNLLKKSVSDYVQKNPDLIFKHSDFLEWTYNGSYLDFMYGNDDLNKAFFSTFSYPHNYQSYKPSDKYKSLSDVSILLNENGKLLKIVSFHHHIYNSANNRFVPYLEKNLRKFVEKSIFSPATYSGFPVKAEINLRIYYK